MLRGCVSIPWPALTRWLGTLADAKACLAPTPRTGTTQRSGRGTDSPSTPQDPIGINACSEEERPAGKQMPRSAETVETTLKLQQGSRASSAKSHIGKHWSQRRHKLNGEPTSDTERLRRHIKAQGAMRTPNAEPKPGPIATSVRHDIGPLAKRRHLTLPRINSGLGRLPNMFRFGT